jgi:hypothetical protein
VRFDLVAKDELGYLDSGLGGVELPAEGCEGLALIFHRGCWLPLVGVVAGFWTWPLVPGYDGGRGCRAGWPGVPRIPGISFLIHQEGFVLFRWDAS